MNETLDLKMGFFSETEAEISIVSTASPARQTYGELLLFACLALRQIVNFGLDHPIGASLAAALAAVNFPLSPVATLLGPPGLSLRRLIAAASADAPDPMRNFVSSDIVRLNASTGREAKKGFLATLRFDDERCRFLLHPKGVAIPGSGTGYYAPLSVTLLLRHLGQARSSDPVFCFALACVSRGCGALANAGLLTIPSQTSLALLATKEAVLKADAFRSAMSDA